MSLRVVQTSREAVLDAVDVPWTRSHRTKVKADLPMCVLVSVQVPLLRFSIAALSASIRPSMSLDVATVVMQLALFEREAYEDGESPNGSK